MVGKGPHGGAICGIAKGVGMIAPDMGTMSFIHRCADRTGPALA